MKNPTAVEIRKETDEAIAKIVPMIVGRHPAVQGQISTELVAIWIAGHDESIRDMILDLHVETLPELVDCYVALKKEKA